MAQRVDSRAMKRARVLPSWVLQWLLNLFPAFLLGGAWVSRVARDCSACRLSVRRSLLTRNLNGTIFGGSLYSACDPIYALLYWQSLARRGLSPRLWVKSARIAFLRPASRRLIVDCSIDERELDQVVAELEREGRATRPHTMELVDADGVVCVSVAIEVYLGLERG